MKLPLKTNKYSLFAFNLTKILGNIFAFSVLCLICFALCQTLYLTIIKAPKTFDIGKGDNLPIYIFYIFQSSFILVCFFFIYKMSKKLFEVQKLRDHFLFWTIPIVIILSGMLLYYVILLAKSFA